MVSLHDLTEYCDVYSLIVELKEMTKLCCVTYIAIVFSC